MLKSTSLYYEESGIVPRKGLLRVLLVGLVGALIGGAMYAYGIFYIPMIHLNVFITLAFGAFLGLLVGVSAHNNHIRKTKTVMLLAAGVALVGGYFAWVFTLLAISGGTDFWLNPVDILKQIILFSQEEYWTVFAWSPSPNALYLIWGLEALTVTIVAVLASISSFGTEPFCERCEEWCKEVLLTEYLEQPIDLDQFIIALENKNYDSLTTLKNNPDYSSNRLKVELLDCPSCKYAHYLKVIATEIVVDEKKNKKENTIILIENLFIDEAAYNKIMTWSQSLIEPVASPVLGG